MEKYHVVITEKAEMDMENIYYHIATESQDLETAIRQYDRIANQILTLAEMPERIRVMDSEPEHTLKVRKMIVGKYNVLFQIKGFKVVVLRVLHSKQDIEGKLFE